MGQAASMLIAQELSESPTGLVGRIDDALVALGPIGLQSLLVTRKVDAPGPRFTITLVYVAPGPVQLRATAYIGNIQLGSATDQMNADLTGVPNLRPHFIRDLSDQRRGSLSIDALMMIASVTSAPNCGYDKSQMIVVRSTENIAAGTSGAAVRVSGTGVKEAITVYNRSSIDWLNNVNGYAFPRAGDCLFDGIPSCC